MSKISELRRYMEYCEEGIAQWGALGEKHVVEWAREEVERLRRYLSSEAAEKPAEPPEVVTLRAEVERLKRDNARAHRETYEMKLALTCIRNEAYNALNWLARRKADDRSSDQAADAQDDAGPKGSGA